MLSNLSPLITISAGENAAGRAALVVEILGGGLDSVWADDPHINEKITDWTNRIREALVESAECLTKEYPIPTNGN